MDILGVGPLELLFIIIIALIVIGPRDIGKAARASGRFLNRLYKSETWHMLMDASRNIRTLPNRLAREAALEDLDEALHSVKEAGKDIAKDVQSVNKDLRKSIAAQPKSISPPRETEVPSGKPVESAGDSQEAATS
jgi:sec-independent protein translocase protein TatB